VRIVSNSVASKIWLSGAVIVGEIVSLTSIVSVIIVERLLPPSSVTV